MRNSSYSFYYAPQILTALLFSIITNGVAYAEGTAGDGIKEQPLSESVEKLNEVVVTAGALDEESSGSQEPALSLSGNQLQSKATNSLGAALSGEAGVAASNFGSAASRPILRGLDGDRVKILENGVGTQDISSSSPDHAVTIESALIDKIELVRGPASLLYGNSAIGGIVNVQDNRIPEILPEGPVSGRAELSAGSVDKSKMGLVSLDTPAGPFAFHLDALSRDTEDYQIPGYARTATLRANGPSLDYPEPRGKLPFSDSNSDNFTFGSSYIRDSGFLGAAISEYNNNYGVPNGENDVSIDAKRKRLDLHGKLFEPIDGIKTISLKAALNDYHHTEFEGAEAGTFFENQAGEARYVMEHEEIAGMQGTIGLQYQHSDFKAVGEEAFQPPTVTNSGSGFFFEELKLSQPLKLQLAGRFDYQDVEAASFQKDGHDPTEMGRAFPAFSQSAGLVWQASKDYALALTLARTERSPSGQELFANGPHVATGAFEIGDPNLDNESSTGIDLSVRKESGRLRGSLGAFYNRFHDYISLIPTGESKDDLRVYRFEAIPADFYGFESKIEYQILQGARSQELTFDLQPDWVWAGDRDTDQAIPRMPPFRLKAGINYNKPDDFSLRLEAQQAFRQDRRSEFETETPSYTLVNAFFEKKIQVAQRPINLFVKGNNLLSEKIRESTSFIKDVAPLPGAGVTAGVRFNF